MRVLGIDPGLTRCGVGVVDVEPNRTARLVDVVVLRSPADLDTPRRLARIADGIEAIIEEHRPQAVALERVFAQQRRVDDHGHRPDLAAWRCSSPHAERCRSRCTRRAR